ncbi:MAG: PIN domain-containing protein [Candidatus Sabulitectum sp.]|nr:PIN domain-containing protein [Candidatus Sabulitectum sp.]
MEKRELIKKWRLYSTEDVVESENILRVASKLKQNGIKKIDSLHIACAISSKADYFLTTDDGILKKAMFIKDIQVTDPIGFIKEVPL